MIKAGLVETIIPMLEIHQPPVVFKILGTLRMLVDGQEELALKFLMDQKLIGQLVEWARNTPDMVGVNSESSRLMAWMIKHGYRSRDCAARLGVEPLKSFIGIDGSVDTLVKMMLSAHLVMQNEALFSLTYLVVFLNQHEAELSRILIASDIGPTLVSFIERMSEMERTTNEIVENLNTLVSALQRLDDVNNHLGQHNIEEKLKMMPRIKELATL